MPYDGFHKGKIALRVMLDLAMQKPGVYFT